MLDIKLVRSNPRLVQEALEKRGSKTSLEEFLSRDERRRSLLVEVEGLKNKRNTVSEEIARLKKAKQDAEPLVLQMRQGVAAGQGTGRRGQDPGGGVGGVAAQHPQPAAPVRCR